MGPRPRRSRSRTGSRLSPGRSWKVRTHSDTDQQADLFEPSGCPREPPSSIRTTMKSWSSCGSNFGSLVDVDDVLERQGVQAEVVRDRRAASPRHRGPGRRARSCPTSVRSAGQVLDGVEWRSPRAPRTSYRYAYIRGGGESAGIIRVPGRAPTGGRCVELHQISAGPRRGTGPRTRRLSRARTQPLTASSTLFGGLFGLLGCFLDGVARLFGGGVVAPAAGQRDGQGDRGRTSRAGGACASCQVPRRDGAAEPPGKVQTGTDRDAHHGRTRAQDEVKVRQVAGDVQQPEIHPKIFSRKWTYGRSSICAQALVESRRGSPRRAQGASRETGRCEAGGRRRRPHDGAPAQIR